MTVNFSAVGPSSSGAGNPTSPATWTHVVAAGDTELLVGVGHDNTTVGAGGLAVTYGGTAMTFVGSWPSGGPGKTVGYVSVWRMHNPPAGSATVSCSWTAGDGVTGGSLSYNGSATIGTITTADSAGVAVTSGTITLTGSTAGNRVVFIVTAGSGGIVFTGGTQRYSFSGAGSGAATGTGGADSAGGGSVTATWTMTSDWYGAIAIEIQAGSSGQGEMQQQRARKRRSRQQTVPPPTASATVPLGASMLRQPVRRPQRRLVYAWDGLLPSSHLGAVVQTGPDVRVQRRALVPRVVRGIVVAVQAPALIPPAITLRQPVRRAQAQRARVATGLTASARGAGAVLRARNVRVTQPALPRLSWDGLLPSARGQAQQLALRARNVRAIAPRRVQPAVYIPAVVQPPFTTIGGRQLVQPSRLTRVRAPARVAAGTVIVAAAPLIYGTALRRPTRLVRVAAPRSVRSGIVVVVQAATPVCVTVLRQPVRPVPRVRSSVRSGFRPPVPLLGYSCTQRRPALRRAQPGRVVSGQLRQTYPASVQRHRVIRCLTTAPRRVQRGQLPFVPPVVPLFSCVLRQRQARVLPKWGGRVTGAHQILITPPVIVFAGPFSNGPAHGDWTAGEAHSQWSSGDAHDAGWSSGSVHDDGYHAGSAHSTGYSAGPAHS